MGGPSYRDKVLDLEIEAVKSQIEKFSPKYNPEFLYCLVEKKINSRFCEKTADNYENPAPGTVVDSGLNEYVPTTN